MHDSVLNWIKDKIRIDEVNEKRILECGSRNINGSAREIFEKLQPAEYIGIDEYEGPGVDQVMKVELAHVNFPKEHFDLIVCTEMLEHAKNWQATVWAMKRVLKIEGLIYVTTRSPGFPLHEYPGDYWRFTQLDLIKAFTDFEILSISDDPQANGVFLKARRVGLFSYRPNFSVFSMEDTNECSA